jgi:hypothetical protein
MKSWPIENRPGHFRVGTQSNVELNNAETGGRVRISKLGGGIIGPTESRTARDLGVIQADAAVLAASRISPLSVL